MTMTFGILLLYISTCQYVKSYFLTMSKCQNIYGMANLCHLKNNDTVVIWKWLTVINTCLLNAIIYYGWFFTTNRGITVYLTLPFQHCWNISVLWVLMSKCWRQINDDPMANCIWFTIINLIVFERLIFITVRHFWPPMGLPILRWRKLSMQFSN